MNNKNNDNERFNPADEKELRNYLIDLNLKIVEQLSKEALKKGNIRKPKITNAKMSQYRVALESIKLLNTILKDKEIDHLNEKIENLEKIRINPDNNYTESDLLSEDILKKLEKYKIGEILNE